MRAASGARRVSAVCEVASPARGFPRLRSKDSFCWRLFSAYGPSESTLRGGGPGDCERGQPTQD
eukprot:9101861-Lingulodinium_polyedra.AAC.1